MKKTYITIALAAIALLATNAVHGAIVKTESFSSNGTEIAFPASNVDLVNQGQASFGSIDTTYTQQINPSTSQPYPESGPIGNINNGNVGIDAHPFTVAPGSVKQEGTYSVTFNLNTTANTFGYEITGVDVFSGWEDRRVDQAWELQISVVGSSSFTSLGSFGLSGNRSSLPDGGYSAKVSLAPDAGVIASNVDAVRFIISNSDSGNGGVYREIDVAGYASIPEPSSIALIGLGILGAIGIRRRFHM